MTKHVVVLSVPVLLFFGTVVQHEAYKAGFAEGYVACGPAAVSRVVDTGERRIVCMYKREPAGIAGGLRAMHVVTRGGYERRGEEGTGRGSVRP